MLNRYTAIVTGEGVKLAVDHIVWDWNGTLLDDNHVTLAAVNQVCKVFSSPEITMDTLRETFFHPLIACYERMLNRKITEQEWVLINKTYHESYLDLLSPCRLTSGALEGLQYWSAGGGSQSLLSMWAHHDLLALVTQLELHQLFSRVDGRKEASTGLGKAKHLEQHVTELALDPTRVVVIGDVLDDAAAASAIGASCVLVSTGLNPKKQLATSGYPVVDSIPEIWNFIKRF